MFVSSIFVTNGRIASISDKNLFVSANSRNKQIFVTNGRIASISDKNLFGTDKWTITDVVLALEKLGLLRIV
jgi:hypothetical protein